MTNTTNTTHTTHTTTTTKTAHTTPVTNHRTATAGHTPVERHALRLIEWPEIQAQLEQLAITEGVKNKMMTLLPDTSIEKIRKDLMETSEARRLLDTGSVLPMNALVTTRRAIEKMEKGMVLMAGELYALGGFLKDSERLKLYMNGKLEQAPVIATYAASLSTLEDLRQDLSACISETAVLDQASPELARLRKKMGLLEDKIKDKLEKVIKGAQYKNVIQDPVISQRNGRYVVPVKAAYKQQLSGEVLDRSTSGATVFIEPEEVKRLQVELHLVRSAEESEVFRILSEFTNAFEPHLRSLHVNLEIFEHYDFIFAKGKLSKRMEGIEPQFSKDPVMKLIQAKHPLLGEKAVPLDFELGFKYKGVVITGPNTGGKTVALKTVALMSVMLRAGLHVPVQKGSIIGYFPKLLADIGDGQSIEQNLSTFSSHITNIIDILKAADHQALVILDEVGSGTDPAEGTGLAVAILEACYNAGSSILATTHYHEIKTFAKDHPGFVNGSMAFDTVSLKPLYRLLLGVPGESNALLIAMKLGLPEPVLDRARAFTYGEADRVQWTQTFDTVAAPEIIESRTLPLESKSSNDEGAILETFRTKDRQAGDYKHQEDAEKEVSRPLVIGDRVKIPMMEMAGLIVEAENRKGEFGVKVGDKTLWIQKKRLQLYIKKEELYPENYDLDIVLKTKTYRKQDKLMNKGKIKQMDL